jgi:hypothetical protein
MVWFFEGGFEILTCEARKREAAYELVVRQARTQAEERGPGDF